MEYAKMSVRSLLLRWRQYFSLFLVAAVGTGVSLFLVFAVNGMINSLNLKAKIYYGGDYHFMGSNMGEYDSDDALVYETFASVFPDTVITSPRYEYRATTAGGLYFEGVSTRQRFVKGVEFDRETPLLEKCNFVEGGMPSAEQYADAVFISEPIARQLGCHVNDTITFMLMTKDGYTNTISLVVRGIFRDSSVFGMYTSYLDRKTLCRAVGYPDTHMNRISVISLQGTPTASDTAKYQAALEQLFVMYPQVQDKDEYLDLVDYCKFDIPTYALLTLACNMQDLRLIIDAMRAVTALVIVVLVIIIVVGISSTYKVIIMKRINELGIYKAIGMKRSAIYKLIGSESLALLIAGALTGVLFSWILCSVIKLFDFTIIPAFDVFLSNGQLVPSISLAGIFAICAIVIVTTLVAVLFSVRDAVKKMPSEALATTA
ncbi:MAG: FtsX-like permease family protein [Treponemataceae bacterium]|nr:FtsX-like permease family protein [Treponemataceae bacterium]